MTSGPRGDHPAAGREPPGRGERIPSRARAAGTGGDGVVSMEAAVLVDELRTWLACELHDRIAGQLQLLLVEMELARREGSGPPELKELQGSVRQALAGVRSVLWELRSRTPDVEAIQTRIDHKLSAGIRQHRRSAI